MSLFRPTGRSRLNRAKLIELILLNAVRSACQETVSMRSTTVGRIHHESTLNGSQQASKEHYSVYSN